MAITLLAAWQPEITDSNRFIAFARTTRDQNERSFWLHYRVRIHVGVEEKGCKASDNCLVKPNEMSRIAGSAGNDGWLPIVDTFRTFAVCPPPEVRAALQGIRQLAIA